MEKALKLENEKLVIELYVAADGMSSRLQANCKATGKDYAMDQLGSIRVLTSVAESMARWMLLTPDGDLEQMQYHLEVMVLS